MARRDLADVREHYRQRVSSLPGSNVSVQDLYDDYVGWCGERSKEPVSLPAWSHELKALGVRKALLRSYGRRRVYYLDIEVGAESRKAVQAWVARFRAAKGREPRDGNELAEWARAQ
jgi:hypothetical protein